MTIDVAKPQTATLAARFELRYPAGATIQTDFELPADGFSVAVLLGPSGSGKTTVLRALAALARPQSGSIRYGDETWFDAERRVCLAPQQRGIGYLAQDYALFPHLNVASNIAYGLRPMAADKRRGRVSDMLERFGLSHLERRYPRQLSGGESQRVALARAMARRPRLLLLDEPLSALDAPLRDRLRRELRRWLADFGVPVVLVTHDRTDALALGDRLVVMAGGRTLQCGSVQEVFARPADVAVATVTGVESVVPGRVVEVKEGLARVTAGDAELLALAPADGASEVFVCIRAEDVVLQRGTSGTTSVRNQLVGAVRSLESQGAMVRVTLDCGFPLAALVTRLACAELNLVPGQSVTAMLKAPSVHLIPRDA
jgi:molybdate transport system ATP-binding protein